MSPAGAEPELAPLGGDAGGRRYYALAGTSAWLAVDAPPDSENTGQFLALAKVLSAGGVRVPRIHSADEHNGFLLVENLGGQLLADAVKSGPGRAVVPARPRHPRPDRPLADRLS